MYSLRDLLASYNCFKAYSYLDSFLQMVIQLYTFDSEVSLGLDDQECDFPVMLV